jgi:hypothetical protein
MPTTVNDLAIGGFSSDDFAELCFFDLGLAGDGLGVTFAVTSRFFKGKLACERLAGIPEAEGEFFFSFIFSSLSLSLSLSLSINRPLPSYLDRISLAETFVIINLLTKLVNRFYSRVESFVVAQNRR